MKLNIQRFAAATVVFAPLNAAINQTIQDPTITLTFSGAVTKAAAAAIANADLASMLAFKTVDADGADVTCSMTISADKKTVTIVPSADLTPNTVYYVGVLADKFYVGEAATKATSASWTTQAVTAHAGTEALHNDITDKALVACGLGGNTYTLQARDEDVIIVAYNSSSDTAYDLRVNAPASPNYAGIGVADLVEEIAAGNIALVNIESAKYVDSTGKINLVAENAAIKLAIFYRK